MDRLRGVAVALMVADHVALVLGAGGVWRLTWTRASLPLFCLVAGSLVRGGPRVGRVLVVVGAGAAATVLGASIGIGQPDVLLLIAASLVLVGMVAGSGLWWALFAVAVIQPTTWPVLWRGYQPGTVLALVMLGQLAGVGLVDRWGSRLPAWVGKLGRRPLELYVGHLVVLAVVL